MQQQQYLILGSSRTTKVCLGSRSGYRKDGASERRVGPPCCVLRLGVEGLHYPWRLPNVPVIALLKAKLIAGSLVYCGWVRSACLVFFCQTKRHPGCHQRKPGTQHPSSLYRSSCSLFSLLNCEHVKWNVAYTRELNIVFLTNVRK